MKQAMSMHDTTESKIAIQRQKSGLTLKERLIRFLTKNPSWIASGELQRIVAANSSYTPSTTSRELRNLENDGTIVVKYIKGHAWYKIATEEKTFQERNAEFIKIFDEAPSPQKVSV